MSTNQEGKQEIQGGPHLSSITYHYHPVLIIVVNERILVYPNPKHRITKHEESQEEMDRFEEIATGTQINTYEPTITFVTCVTVTMCCIHF